MLHIAASAALGVDARMIAALDEDAAISVQSVVNVHAAPVIVEPGDSSIRPPVHVAIVGLHDVLVSRGRHAMAAGATAWMTAGRVGPEMLTVCRAGMTAGRGGPEVLTARRAGMATGRGCAMRAGDAGGWAVRASS